MRTLPALVIVALLALTAASGAAQTDILLQLNSTSSQPRLVVDSAGGLLLRGNVNRGTIPAAGAGVRMMWYPRRGAFRAGVVPGAQWDDGYIGYYSAAVGSNNTASGSSSFSMGEGNTASAYASLAGGGASTASGDYSVAIGLAAMASGKSALALGTGASASSESAVAIGNYAEASGFLSVALGSGVASASSAVMLGYGNVASGDFSTAMGFRTTASGPRSTALGHYADTNAHDGALVYGDASTTNALLASADNQVSARAAGGYRFFTNSLMTLGAQLQPNQTAWSVLSDRTRKRGIAGVDGEYLLSRLRLVPVTTWIYADQPDAAVRHIGPMAQDWRDAFGLSADSLTINSGDFDGVNLAASQALELRTRSQESRIAALETENAELRARLGRIEQLLARSRP